LRVLIKKEPIGQVPHVDRLFGKQGSMQFPIVQVFDFAPVIAPNRHNDRSAQDSADESEHSGTPQT